MVLEFVYLYMAMKDSSKIMNNVLDTLDQHPIVKGLVPTAGGVSLTFINELEIWLRLAGVTVGLCIGLLTLYAKIRTLVRDHKK